MKSFLIHGGTAVIHAAVWLIPIAIAAHPEWQTTSISVVLSGIVSWLSHKNLAA